MTESLISIEEKKRRIIEELQFIDDPYERFSYVIDRGKQHHALDPQFKTDEYRIEGCMSQLWVSAEFRGGLCYFAAESDSSITKGIAALLCELYSGHTPDEIVSVDPGFLADVGITQHLSPNRRNGLTRVVERIQSFAKLRREEPEIASRARA